MNVPDWFEALNADFRYQLTAIGAPGPNLFIAQEISGDHGFTIGGGTLGMKVSWQVTGVRKDAYAKAHPLEVEQVKPAAVRGRYLHPKEHGQPESLGIYSAREVSVSKSHRAPGNDGTARPRDEGH